eukprot:758111-Prymnesium_polylepis.1
MDDERDWRPAWERGLAATRARRSGGARPRLLRWRRDPAEWLGEDLFIACLANLTGFVFGPHHVEPARRPVLLALAAAPAVSKTWNRLAWCA